MDDTVRCINGDADISFSEEKCPVCGTFHSFPNVRKAQQEHDALLTLYDAAQASAKGRGVIGKVVMLEACANTSKIVVNTELDFIYQMIKDPKVNYVGYARQVDAAVRKAAIEQHHIDRSVADEVLFPSYREHIVYAALSSNGSGLTNYGPVGVFLKDAVAPLRVSLLIENSYQFLKRHFKYAQPLPRGYRGTWDDRGRLAVVKLAAAIDAATPDGAIGDLLLRTGPTRWDDDFIEAYIYDGFDKRAIEHVILNRVLASPSDQNRWQELTELLSAEGIDFHKAGTPL